MQDKNTKPKILAIVGPTATGKSSLSVFLAKKLGGEIVSTDSRQVYKGLNIGSGKITKKEMGGVPHHMLDIISPKKVFTAGDYSRLGQRALVYILKNKKLPIVCGGTGFYADVLLGKISVAEVSPNIELRKRLEKKSVEELFEKIKKRDPKRALSIDRHNRVRLIRALEILEELGEIPKNVKENKYDILWIGLDAEKSDLDKKIEKRLLDRINSGMIEEVEVLHKGGLSWKRLESLGLEYRYISKYLQGKLTKEEMTETLLKEIKKYSKRQRTWFKKNKEIKWFDCMESDINQKVYKSVLEWIEN